MSSSLSPDSASRYNEAERLVQAGCFAQAESIYRELRESDPSDPDAAHFLGAILVKQGKIVAGLELVARSVAMDPNRVMFRHNYALLLKQTGDLERAETELLASVSVAPSNPLTHHYLGMVRQQSGRLDDALVSYNQAAALAPSDPGIANSLGICHLERGEIDSAITNFRRSLSLDSFNAMAHNNLGAALKAKGDLRGAIASFRSAVDVDRRNGQAWCNFGNAMRALGDQEGAFDAFHHSIKLAPEFVPAWQEFSDALAQIRPSVWDPMLAEDILLMLQRSDICLDGLAEAAAELLLLDPQLRPVLCAAREHRESTEASFRVPRLSTLGNSLLLLLVEKTLVRHPVLEQFLVAFRSQSLAAWDMRWLAGAPDELAWILAIAQQCFLNEYLWSESSTDTAIARRLEAKVDTDDATPLEIALLACFRRLSLRPPRAKPPDQIEAFERFWKRQVEEPAEEASLRREIPSLTMIDDPISRAVRSQYEEHPYPLWQCVPANQCQPYPYRSALKSLFPDIEWLRLEMPEKTQVLIAGCGTGLHPAKCAIRNPDANILAVDLSLSSLAHAMRRCRQLGLSNIRFAQADILRLAEADDPQIRRGDGFDAIESGGVLHHLADPLAGWRVLATLLKKGGVMKLALYSQIARSGIVAARQLIADRALSQDLVGVRAARQLVWSLPDGHPAKTVSRTADFYSASGVRDLILHTHEHRFTIPELRACIDSLGLEFLGFEHSDPSIQTRFLASFSEVGASRSLEKWDQFERAHPQAFQHMYQFWMRKPLD